MDRETKQGLSDGAPQPPGRPQNPRTITRRQTLKYGLATAAGLAATGAFVRYLTGASAGGGADAEGAGTEGWRAACRRRILRSRIRTQASNGGKVLR